MTKWYEDDSPIGGPFPLSPERAADRIVLMLLPDLPPHRRQEVKEAIEEWGEAWGSLCSLSKFR